VLVEDADYFLQSHGFNTVHAGCLALTGANLANATSFYLGVSGDGDSAQSAWAFAHVMRRGVNMTYISRTTACTG